MRVSVRLFASYREAVGSSHLLLELPEGATVRDALAAIVEQFPSVAPMISSTRFALNQDYVPAETRLGDCDELVLIPPVAGGGA